MNNAAKTQAIITTYSDESYRGKWFVVAVDGEYSGLSRTADGAPEFFWATGNLWLLPAR